MKVPTSVPHQFLHYYGADGMDLSVGMGALTLIGIAVNNAIVLLDYANRKVAAGQTIGGALRSAVSTRLRPILMTALTTIFALIPVAVNPAVGSRSSSRSP